MDNFSNFEKAIEAFMIRLNKPGLTDENSAIEVSFVTAIKRGQINDQGETSVVTEAGTFRDNGNGESRRMTRVDEERFPPLIVDDRPGDTKL